MGISRKSHGKKSDKETQSPVLKIFKDIMQKERTDPEKVNLLKDKKREKKRKTHPETRPKSDQRSYDSSSTGRYRTNEQTKITVQGLQEDKNGAFNDNRTKSEPFQSEKRESWWLWGDNQNQQKENQKRTDDTCSCVSCALKKIVGSEYTCVACLFILFSLSVAVIFLTVFKTMSLNDIAQVKSGDDDSLVNKMRALKEKRQLTEGYGWSDYTERNRWDDSSNLEKLSGALESDYIGVGIKNSNFPDLSSLSGDLANVLSSQNIMEGRKSDRLREFFKKLIQTDTQIRKLKQDIGNNYLTDVKTITDRYKRSAQNKQPGKNKTKIKSKYEILDNEIRNDVSELRMNKTENKRSIKTNDTDVKGIMIKEEKIFIKYEPERRRNFPKCSHSHETKSHEKKLKHPFYKNSQRVDEMLDQYDRVADKNINNNDNKLLIVEKNKKGNEKLQIKVNNKNGKDKEVTKKDNIYDNIEDIFFQQQTNTGYISNDSVFNIDTYLSSTPMYDVALSISTFISPTMNTDNPKRKYTPINRPGYRRLMQVDDEEDKEDLVYEDLNEVLEDEGQNQDDADKQVERNKRDDRHDAEPSVDPSKYSPQNTHNLNWKGPMPLYPDELSAMIKQGTLENVNQIPFKDKKNKKERIGKDVTDTEYIENYSDNKYNKMLKMAQAYSDYGVLYGKKDRVDAIKNNDENNQNNKLKPYSIKNSLLDRFFGRSKKGSCDGITIQQKHGTVPNEREEFMKSIQKHIKIVKCPPKNQNIKKMHQINGMYKPTELFKNPDNERQKGENVIFPARKARSLKSIEMADDNVTNDTDDVINPPNKDNSNANDNKITFSTDGVLNFLSVMSDWLIHFSKRSSNDYVEESKNTLSDANQNSEYNATRKKQIMIIGDSGDNNTQSDMNYPSYDSDMVDNIGHRSRVLMSFENETKINEMLTKNDPLHTSTESDSIVPIALVLANNDNQNKTKDMYNNKVQFKHENKTIVKRNAKDTRSVFWSDIYDDEYGVKIDYLENIRNKHSAKKGQKVLKKSKDWLQDRFKNLTHKFESRLKNKFPTAIKKIHVNASDTRNTPKRPVRHTNNNEDINIKRSFADLTENMKKVCREAAKAVQDTKNIEVREERKEDGEATSLMQQLVRLMTDLVDIQVQQKNCAKLPSDLYQFLEWLTVPEDSYPEVNEVYPGPSYNIDDSLNRFEKSTYPSFDAPLTEDTHQEDRTECLGTIRAVQDLIQQYEGMSDEDKSKMTGVKEYLENQLKFLNRKLNSFAETNVSVRLYKYYNKRESPRKRRDLRSKAKDSSDGKFEDRKPHKFVKIFQKKRTKSTLSTYDGVTVTKAKKKLNIPYRNREIVTKDTVKDNTKDKDNIHNNKGKRFDAISDKI